MEPAVSFLSGVTACQYLPDRLSQLRYEICPRLTAAEYMARLASGWRRFGPVLFRPECPSCTMCQSLRVLVASFSPSAGQRRVWKRNAGVVSVQIGHPSVTPERQRLYERFHEHGAAAKGWPSNGHAGLDLFVRNPFTTEEWSYYIGERLVGAGYVDVLPDGLSAIYFFHDPAEARRSLGTFNILTMIAAARERRLPHVYLGYYVEGCRSLEYKARFRPHDVLRGGTWQPAAPR